MPLVLADRVRETTTVSGTNDATLLGAVTGFQSFAVIGDTNTCYYTISDNVGNWEVGIGTYSTSGPTLARTTVLSSSNSGSKVSFPSGTKDIFVTYPSEKSINLDESGYVDAGGSYNVTLNGNLTFNGTTRRITGDFNNATTLNRVAFQTSTTNASTTLEVLPNGTSSTSALILETSSSDPANAAYGRVIASSVDFRLDSGIRGTGTYLPLTMYTGGSERMRIDTSGNLLLGTSTSFTSTTVAGALKMDGYGVYPYLNTSGATNTGVVSGFTYQNSTPYSGDNGATSTTLVATLVQARLSNSGVGGTNSINIQAGNFGTVISNVATTARISAIGISGAAARNISTDVSTDTSNSLTGVAGSATHGASAGAGIVSTNAIAGLFNATNQNGTTTTIEGVRSGIGVATSPTALTSSATNASGVRSIVNVGAASGGPGTVTNLFGFVTQGPVIGATGTVTNYFGLYIDTPSGSGTLSNRVGVWQNDASSFNYFAGNVGIGTTGPGVKLDVIGDIRSVGSGSSNAMLIGGTADGALLQLNRGGSASQNAFISQYQGSLFIKNIDSGDFVFTNTTSDTERMRITSAGNVSIATGNLTFAGTGQRITGDFSNATIANRVFVQNSVTNGSTSFSVIPNGTSAVSGLFAFNNSNPTNASTLGVFALSAETSIRSGITGTGTFLPLSIYTSNTERMRIDTSGNVGIGSSSISNPNKLDVVASNADQRIAMRTQDTSGQATVEAQVNNYWTGSTFTGTAITQYDSAATGTTVGLSNANLGALRFQNGSNALIYTNGGTPIIFGTTNTERMRITPGGDVGIGTSSTTAALTVSATSTSVFQAINTATPSTSAGAGIVGYTDGTPTAADQRLGFYLFGSRGGVGGTYNSAGMQGFTSQAWTLGSAQGSYLTFATTPSNSATRAEAMRIDQFGNLLVGTTSALGRLHSKAAGAYDSAIVIESNTAAGNWARADWKNSNVATTGIIYLDQTNNFAIRNDGNGPVSFYTNGSNERMRIDSGGSVLVGTTSNNFASSNHQVVIAADSSVANPFGINNLQSGTGSSNCVFFGRNGTFTGGITNTGSTTAYNTSSDHRLKENVQPMQNALGVVAQLKPVTYNWKIDGSVGQGFIAHELQAVVPDAVTGEKDAVDKDGKPKYQGVDTSFLVATLAAAIQEQQKMIEELKQEVAKLKGV